MRCFFNNNIAFYVILLKNIALRVLSKPIKKFYLKIVLRCYNNIYFRGANNEAVLFYSRVLGDES